MSKINEVCKNINDICIVLQGAEKEVVDDITAFEAYACVKNMLIRYTGDALLFCAALNLLNTYVKQKDAKLGYRFKRELSYLLGVSLCIEILGVDVDVQKDGRNNLVVVQICGIQFSYHNILVTKELKNIRDKRIGKQSLEWDGIRKQKCALTLYRLAMENIEDRIGLTFRGKNLNNKLTSLVENFIENKIDFSDI